MCLPWVMMVQTIKHKLTMFPQLSFGLATNSRLLVTKIKQMASFVSSGNDT